MGNRLMATLAIVTLLGCGKPSASEKCASFVSTLCKKIFQCAAGATPYTSEADCEAKETTQIRCSEWMVPASCNYDWSKFDACVNDLGNASCSAIAQGQEPPSCDNVGKAAPSCVTSGGGIYCSDSSGTVANNGCTQTESNCSDGKTYEVSCSASGCQCLVNGVVSKNIGASGGCSPNQAVLNQECGWNLAVTYQATDMR